MSLTRRAKLETLTEEISRDLLREEFKIIREGDPEDLEYYIGMKFEKIIHWHLERNVHTL